MAKKLLGQWTEKDERFTKRLKGRLTDNGKTYKNLVKRTGKSHSVIYKRYHHPETTTVEELRIFIQEAGLSEEDILNFLFKDRG